MVLVRTLWHCIILYSIGAIILMIDHGRQVYYCKMSENIQQCIVVSRALIIYVLWADTDISFHLCSYFIECKIQWMVWMVLQFFIKNPKWKNLAGNRTPSIRDHKGMAQSLVSHNQLACIGTGIGYHIYILQGVEMFEKSLSYQLDDVWKGLFDMWGSAEQIWNWMKKVEPKWLKLFGKMAPPWSCSAKCYHFGGWWRQNSETTLTVCQQIVTYFIDCLSQ